MILEMMETSSTAMRVNLSCNRRAKMKVMSSVLMLLHQAKKIVLKTQRRAVIMKLRVVEVVEIRQIVFAKGRQDNNKLLLFGESHMEQHRTWNNTGFIQKIGNIFKKRIWEQGSRVGVVVRALAFHQCVPGLIPGLICESYVG